ncbi:MAG: hypothetical protein ACE5K0_12500 [Candidatus Methanofastidiosia archaeon]
MGYAKIEDQKKLKQPLNIEKIVHFFQKNNWKVKVFENRVEADYGSSILWNLFGDAGLTKSLGDPMMALVEVEERSIKIKLESKIWTWGGKHARVSKRLREVLQNFWEEIE